MPDRNPADDDAVGISTATSRESPWLRPHDRPPSTDAEIRAWVVGKVAAALAIPESAVDTGASLISLGLDSVTLFSMTGELAERLDRDLPASLLFEVASIDDLLAALASPGTVPP